MKTLKFTLCVISMVCASNTFAQDKAPGSMDLAAVVGGSSTSSHSTASHSTESTVKQDVKKDVKEAKQYLSDAELTAKVKETFVKEKLFGKDKFVRMGVRVKTKQGVVTLSGKVTSQEEVDTAVKLAKSVEGVKDVKSDIKIKASKKK